MSSGNALALEREIGFRVLNRIELPAGRYQLRLAARDAAKQVVGSVLYDLEVPDFSKAPLMMSGLALMSASAGQMMTAPPDKSFTEVLPVAATAPRIHGKNSHASPTPIVEDDKMLNALLLIWQALKAIESKLPARQG